MSITSRPNLDKVFDNIIRRAVNADLDVNTITSSVDGMQLSVERSGKSIVLLNSDRDLVRFIEELRKHSDKDRFVCNAQIISDDDMTIGDCLVKEDSVISVVERSRGVKKVKVETLDGRTIIVGVRKKDKIVNIEEKIKERIRFDRSEHRLEYRGVVLSYYDTIEDSAISEGSVIRVVKIPREEMMIYLRTEDGRVAPLTVGIRESIFGVKSKIRNKIGLSPDELKLVFQGELLEDDKTLHEYHIVENSFLDLGAQSRGEMTIFTRTLDGKTLTIQVSYYNTIMDIKKEIQEKIGVAPEEQKLVYQVQLLEDDKTVDDYGIREESVIHVVFRLRGEMQIFAKRMEGNIVSLEVSKYDTIMDLKKKIEKKIGVAPDEQKLEYRGQRLEDDYSLKYYQIAEKSVIRVIEKLRGGGSLIFVQTMEGRRIEVRNITRIMDIKKKIQDELGLEAVKQILVYRGRILEDDNERGRYIADNSTICVVTDSRDVFSINIKMVDSPLDTLTVTSVNTIIELKESIEEMRGHPIKEQLLKKNGMILRDDSLTMLACGVVKNDTIEVSTIERLTINIIMFNMETVPLEVLKSDRVADVKKKIEKKIELLQQDQILVLRRRILCEDSNTVDQCHLLEKSDILVTARLRNFKEKIRGICLVINNEKFSGGHKVRNGTQRDEESIRSTFAALRYQVKVYRDVSSSRMQEIIAQTKRDIENSHKMLVVFVLSHGEEKSVIMSDGASFLIKDIWTPFTNGNFPKLAGKPKVFFFACCRGSKVNEGVRIPSSSHVETDGPNSERTVYPAMADLLIGYATCKYYKACRCPSEGTFYVQHLCEAIQEQPLWSVADIHQKVQSTVSMINFGANCFQLPCFESFLTDHAYFMD